MSGVKGSKIKEHYRPDPFHKAKIVKQSRDAEILRSEQARLDAKTIVAKKMKERKKKAKLLMKRTRKGQPIMRHVIENLVSKLEK